MKVKFSVALLLTIGLLLTGCTSKDKMDFYDQTYSIDLSAEEIQEVSLGASEQKLVAVFGTPAKVEEVDTPPSRYYVYNNLEFKVEDGSIIGYILSHERHATARNVTIGATKERVIELYEKNYHERTKTGAAIIGYFDKQLAKNIEFTFNEEVLIGIMVSAIKSGAH
ncbi:hypothetical protein SAMN05421743_103353 [Thalassobacillus cyri]|uniref:Uncharacterized protein n=1 Tax=Thalassobacillus cyri TaxID=571932 RepID=A0A1H3ZTL0_9BACI|nr:hypothetical protein [Thalassobacillus cyri]SEA26622.1 hypothetical protein SAMN05421743_103353 [Thalassobacillus cyri]